MRSPPVADQDSEDEESREGEAMELALKIFADISGPDAGSDSDLPGGLISAADHMAYRPNSERVSEILT